MDNFAYYLRACGGDDRFAVEPLVRVWSATYDLVVRLLPDVALRADGVRSTSDTFRDDIEAILDARLPALVRPDRLAAIRASQVTDDHDWWSLAERLAEIVGQPLLADGVPARPTGGRPGRKAGQRASAPDGLPTEAQLPLELDDR
jgi:hypothetical protein